MTKQKNCVFKNLLVIFFIALYFITFAGDIDKAFKYLNTGDYPNASKYLYESVVQDPGNAAVNFGLAKFYFLKDNKSYNLDSANYYIKRAVKKVPLNPEDKQTKKFLTLGVRDYTIQNLQQEINKAAFTDVEQENTVESYQYFLNNFTDAGLLARAMQTRNQLAFIRARGKNDPKALAEFVKNYPNADEIKDAKTIYDKLLYEQTTADKTYTSYKSYFDQYPNGAYVTEAKKNYQDKLLEYYNNKHDLVSYIEFEKKYKDNPAYNSIQDSIYVLSTQSGTIDAYLNFVKNFKSNRNYKDAFEQFYTLYNAEATEFMYHKFMEQFPDFPNQERLHKDMELSKLELKPFKQGNKWGYAAQPRPDSLTVILSADYEEAFAFKNGVAAVRTTACTAGKCNYFYIDKKGDRAIAGNFNFASDFENGFAIAGIGNCESDSCKYGMIDKRGHWVIKPVYDELNDPTGGLYLVSKHDKFGFINQAGDVVISVKYNNAVSFSEGAAAVALDTSWFFIDSTGKQLFIDNFSDVSSFKEGLCAVTADGTNWGYINKAGTFVISPVYEDADDFEGGFAIVSKKEKDPKHRDLMISQRYKIDKTGKVIEKLTAPSTRAKKTITKKRTR